MPLRLDAFRVQAARALGANIHRMSHNPYREGLYDLLDALGVLVWNENRDFGPAYTYQMGEMARRDRNHASIIVNSLGNEVELVNLPSVGRDMVRLSKQQDPSRPTTANSNAGDGLFAVIDVQGFSHSAKQTFVSAHGARPAQPLVLSECCSCTTQRFPSERTSDECIYTENAPGIDLDFVAGSLGGWTLLDYFGEPPGPWPFVSSSFGQFDLAGFPKPNAYVYAAMWRERVATADRPALRPAPVARVLSLLDQLGGPGGGGGGGAAAKANATVSGIVSSAFAELLADGVSQGVQASAGRALSWTLAGGKPAAVTLRALDASKSVVASHSLAAPAGAAPAALALVVDVPSAATGTGARLYLDGDDVALVRVSTVDAAGALISVSPTNVTFAVLSGPGRVAGVNSGDPASHEQPNGATVATFGGVARALVQVSADCTSALRDRVLAIDADGNARTRVLAPGAACPAGPIVLQASARGLAAATIEIGVSGDDADAPLAAAVAAFDTAAIAYLEGFAG